jgi:uncharacterized phage protein (TIGR02220 family)
MEWIKITDNKKVKLPKDMCLISKDKQIYFGFLKESNGNLVMRQGFGCIVNPEYYMIVDKPIDKPKIKLTESMCEDLMNYWNSKGISKKTKVTTALRTAISGKFNQGFSIEDMKTAIDNYAVLYLDNSPSTEIYKWKWDMLKFIKQSNGMETYFEKDVSSIIQSNNMGRVNV